MSPRSILKCPSSSLANTQHSPPPPSYYSSALPYPPQVHFPPSEITQTFTTHSGAAYDRAPIVVLPNDCELPARGCPGRTYDPNGEASKRRSSKEDKAAARCSRSGEPRESDVRIPSSRPPPLVPDISSESDESDGLTSPPPEYFHGNSIPLHLPPHSHSISPSQEHFDKALAFLPHSPNPTKDREKKRRSCSSKPKPKFKSEDGARSFAASSLDGCLGGF